ncbi:MAG: hypothetical protein NT154_39845 [Verrucomicrobia bacterium]|nr:hypothetical protein [Verrucomicrobiota bacterium]
MTVINGDLIQKAKAIPPESKMPVAAFQTLNAQSRRADLEFKLQNEAPCPLMQISSDRMEIPYVRAGLMFAQRKINVLFS